MAQNGRVGRPDRRKIAIALTPLAAAALLGAVAYFTWKGLDDALGRSLAGQAVSVLTSIAAAFAVYAGAVWVLRVPEARQIPRLLGRGASTGP